jgi:NAD(P)H dehydrogenase (quinone)
VSGNVAVIYSCELDAVAQAFAEAAGHLATHVRVLRLAGAHDQADDGGSDRRPELTDLEWADGIAFGTPIGDGAPDAELMRFIASTEPLWSTGRLYDKAVTVFTDEPEHMAPDSVLHPIYDALYRWGAVIVGPRGFELELEARPTAPLVHSASELPAARLKTAQYRAVRLARLAGILAEEHARRARYEF